MRRKPKTKSRGDEQKPDMRRDAFGASGHVTAKPSICNSGGDAAVDAFCKSGAYARKDSCLTTGDLPGVAAAREAATEGWETGFDRWAEVSKGRTRPGAPGQRPERSENWALT